MSTVRDQRIAEQAAAAAHPRELLCAAYGCPNRWSIDRGNGRLCSAHAQAEPHHWPEVTQREQWAETDRAQQLGAWAPPGAALSFDDRRAVLADVLALQRRMSDMRGDPKAWALALREREERGERLSPALREMWRSALGQQIGHEPYDAMPHEAQR